LGSFKISKYEVTQKQWRDVMGTDPSYFTECDSCPVEQVSWHDVQNFLQKLKVATNKNYRLPTEAEWEYAARGGQNYLYAGSDDINSVAWYQDNAYLVGLSSPNYGTNPVGQKLPNGYGLYDMSGNVFEMCQDAWNADYNGAPADGSAWTSGGNVNVLACVLRGGSWWHQDFISNSFYRSSIYKTAISNQYGFRLAL
jgi:formylglycine-generating enzyme required for sulfatase activity